MFEIIISILINFLTLSGIFVLWKLFGSVKKSTYIRNDYPIKTGERSAHSNLSLTTIGISSFLLFPMLLVGVRWTEAGKKIDMTGHLYMLGFLLTGVISYLYFVRGLKGGNK